MKKDQDSTLDGFRRHNLGWILLRLGNDFFRHHTGPELFRYGYAEIRTSHTAVLVNLPLEGARITDLAARARVTKQAIGLIVDELEEMSYVERMPDPTDGRAKIVRFTKKGLKFLSDAQEIVEGTWTEYAKLFGKRRLRELHDELEALLDALEESERGDKQARQLRRAS